MKELNLEQMGVQKMNALEVKDIDGGHMVGYAKWYHQQKIDAAADFWTWFMLAF
jgi:hypothetical protein